MSWYLFILGFLAVLAFCRALAGKRNAAAAEKGILLAACALLLVFMAFRAESVGADTRQYTTAFEQIRNMSLGECLTKTVYGAGGNHAIGLEYGYRLYNWLLGQLFRHPQAVTAANSVLIIFLLYPPAIPVCPFLHLAVCDLWPVPDRNEYGPECNCHSVVSLCFQVY